MVIRDDSGNSRELKNSVIILSRHERLLSSLKIFLRWFLYAFFSVFLPVLHFLLVPIFLFCAFFLSIKKFNQLKSINLTSEICPNCKEDLKKNEIFFVKDSIDLECINCRATLKLF